MIEKLEEIEMNQFLEHNEDYKLVKKLNDKLNEIIKVVNKTHTCDCHRCPSEE